MKMQSNNPINKMNLHLERGSGQMLSNQKRGKYWHIFYGEKRVGKIYIDYFNNEILGNHPAIEIFINKGYQGRGIGAYSYELACKESGLKKIYMHARKSNPASIRAASIAGFIEVSDPSFKQTVMVWIRPSKHNIKNINQLE